MKFSHSSHTVDKGTGQSLIRQPVKTTRSTVTHNKRQTTAETSHMVTGAWGGGRGWRMTAEGEVCMCMCVYYPSETPAIFVQQRQHLHEQPVVLMPACRAAITGRPFMSSASEPALLFLPLSLTHTHTHYTPSLTHMPNSVFSTSHIYTQHFLSLKHTLLTHFPG